MNTKGLKKKQLRTLIEVQESRVTAYRQMYHDSLDYLSMIAKTKIPDLVSEYIKELSLQWITESKRKVSNMEGMYAQAKTLDSIDAEIQELTDLGFIVIKDKDKEV